MPPVSSLRTTPLHSTHRSLGAKMVDFGGWDMPVQYSGIIEEHNAVRTSVGMFDVSHMGEIEIRGPEAAKLTEFVTTNHVAKLKLGQAHYSGLLYDHGGFVDDILVHKVAGAACHTGTQSSRHAAKAHARRPGIDSLLLVYRWRSSGHAGSHRAYGLHG
jgi:glycine cleavage system aminomethyltransferase T